jgi:hypothetical protein
MPDPLTGLSFLCIDFSPAIQAVDHRPGRNPQMKKLICSLFDATTATNLWRMRFHDAEAERGTARCTKHKKTNDVEIGKWLKRERRDSLLCNC